MLEEGPGVDSVMEPTVMVQNQKQKGAGKVPVGDNGVNGIPVL